MITVQVEFANGNKIITSINASLAEARAYYVGKTFNLGREEDDLTIAVKCDLIENDLNILSVRGNLLK